MTRHQRHSLGIGDTKGTTANNIRAVVELLSDGYETLPFGASYSFKTLPHKPSSASQDVDEGPSQRLGIKEGGRGDWHVVGVKCTGHLDLLWLPCSFVAPR